MLPRSNCACGRKPAWTIAPTGQKIMAMTVCKLVRYAGRVQGVGFRYTAQRLAAGFPVSGYVRNLPGGDVELVAEGEPEAVDAFLAAVAERMGGYIARTEVQEAAAGGHRGFQIRH